MFDVKDERVSVVRLLEHGVHSSVTTFTRASETLSRSRWGVGGRGGVNDNCTGVA